jgi:PHD/YefM family antitoxin component YafN of YafNO toxin-antitoxin module
MNAIRGAIENTVSISQFNKGLAGKIFAEVRRCGAKVVMKNNAPECVLLAPDEYIKLMDEVNDARLLTLAAQRMEQFDPSKLLSQSVVDTELGFSADDLSDAEEIEFE